MKQANGLKDMEISDFNTTIGDLLNVFNVEEFTRYHELIFKVEAGNATLEEESELANLEDIMVESRNRFAQYEAEEIRIRSLGIGTEREDEILLLIAKSIGSGLNKSEKKKLAELEESIKYSTDSNYHIIGVKKHIEELTLLSNEEECLPNTEDKKAPNINTPTSKLSR